MQRTVRLKCPGCQTAIEAKVGNQERVSLSCPACAKQFVARVPLPPKDTVGAQVVQRKTTPVVAAKPIVRATPKVPATPAPDYRTEAPLPDPLSFPVPMAPMYVPVRKKKPINLKPYIAGIGGLIGLVLLALLGLFGWQWAANTDWSTFSLVPVSHERLINQVVSLTEQNGKAMLDRLEGKDNDIETLKRRSADWSREFESILVRAVRLKWAPREERQKLTDRMKTIEEKYRPQIEAKLKALRDAKLTPPGPDEKKLIELASTKEWLDSAVISMAGAEYINNGIFDLPAPANQPEQIYYEETDLIQEYLKVLAGVRRSGQSIAAADKINQLAERVLQLAIRRSKLPANAWEVVPREYVEKDRALALAQRALIVRMLRDAQPDEALKDAVGNFLDAREQIQEAARGTTEIKLRDVFAANKTKRAASNIHPPGDPFHETVSSKRDLVAKPQADLTPDVEMPVATDVNPTAPQVEPKIAGNKPGSASPSASSSPTQASPPAPSSTSNSVASNSAPPNNQTTTASPPPDSGGAPSGYMPRTGALPGFRGLLPPRPGGFGPGGFGPGGFGPGGFGPGGFGAEGFGPPQGDMAMPHEPSPRARAIMPGETPGPGWPEGSVQIEITNFSQDAKKLSQRLADMLGIGHYGYSQSGSLTKITLGYTGDLQNVVKVIDFGNIETVDQAKRTITVRAK